jgi:hypothetical protein
MTGSVCPIFNDNLKLKCGTEAQNIELQIAVANMRTSLRQYLEDAQPTDELAELCLRELINSIQKVRVQKNLKGTQMTSQPRVPTFESMGSDPDDLDFSKCSIMAYAQKGDDNTLLRDLDLRGDEEDYPNTDWNPIFRLMGDKMSELHDWGFNKDLTEAVGYDSDENLLQDLEGQKKEAATQKWKQSAVGIDSEMTDF